MKNNYQLLTIKLLIVLLFAATLYIGISRVYNRWYFDWIRDSKELMTNGQFINYIKSSFRPSLAVLIPFVGIFTNKKIGWILITSFFYMLLSSLAFSAFQMNTLDNPNLLFNIVGIGLFTLLTLIMNIKKVWNGTYGFVKPALLRTNIIASIIGMGLTILVAYIRQ